MIYFIKSLLGICLAAILAYIAIYNRGEVHISFGPYLPEMVWPAYAVIYTALAVGVFMGIIYGWVLYGPLTRKDNAKSK